MAEIRRSPVEVGSLSHYLQGFSTIPGGCLGFQPSTVVWDWMGLIYFNTVSIDNQTNMGNMNPMGMDLMISIQTHHLMTSQQI